MISSARHWLVLNRAKPATVGAILSFLLRHAGYQPSLFECIVCGIALEAEINF